MGLLDSLLEVPEHLRVWQMAGVRHFYLDPDAVPVPGDRPPGDQPGLAALPLADSPAGAACGPGSDASPCAAATVATPSAAVLAASEASQTSPPTVLPPHPGDWPQPWPGLFAKAPARPRLVIAYRELGLDLTGQADPRRGGLWRNLIRDLRLTGQNAVAFWPLALPRDGELVDQPEAFAAGLALFSPEITAVFGPLPEVVAAALAARTDTATLPITVLPHPDVLLQGDPEVWDHVCSLLGID
ncbi:hypothetical protein GTA51_06200 [Desulfovibrio aerotolerans]|uniref:Uncharacterized protein n=1 Tax=Solidesulfovibrio aerotolerans TaxID=295255 RepID=A0A7C9IS33_9BACT|nr:hypothetical protein [Solidesulfovibrio aerotolerans]MYL82727.1 hypothetical protein [Solidesulfovibrio aerotolerans]